ncbi:hypothetical protein [Clostridium estertheticum]|uniref:hypothetical protein n=1 Tax=Clostridium estertheticum TaxID=238834 RepID=UPI001CF30F79|nr:hypothetical protein [Clostridium estertheticum]MCB2353927.1 hypothetical protein [Clostridium estertheticum]WAG43068.1 hypothetical protein LL065_10460 [Clostridium estertheticum]
MITINNIELVKKRLMFSIAEDSYFLTYNIIIILGLLGCFNNKYLKDLNKIALLVTIIEKHENIEVTRRILGNKDVNYSDKEVLFDMYYNSKLRSRSVTSIIFSLNKQGIVNVRKSGKTIDISLTNSEIYIKFVDENLFKDDVKVYKEIFMNVNKIKGIISDTFNDMIFKGIKEDIWVI